MMKKIIYGLLSFAPVMAFAQNTSPTAPLGNVVNLTTQVKYILGLLIPMVFGLAVLYFFWGVAKYILSAGDAKAADSGKSIMIYGVIAIAVMASIWGLVTWLQNTVGVSNQGTITVPTIGGTGNGFQ